MARTGGQVGWCYRADGADGQRCSAAGTLPILTKTQKIEYYLHTTDARAPLIREHRLWYYLSWKSLPGLISSPGPLKHTLAITAHPASIATIYTTMQAPPQMGNATA